MPDIKLGIGPVGWDVPGILNILCVIDQNSQSIGDVIYRVAIGIGTQKAKPMAVLLGDLELQAVVNGIANALHLRYPIKPVVEKDVDSAPVESSSLLAECCPKLRQPGRLVGNARCRCRPV